MNIDDYLSAEKTITVNIAESIREMSFPQRLALIRHICEELGVDESMKEVRQIVNDPLFDDAQTAPGVTPQESACKMPPSL